MNERPPTTENVIQFPVRPRDEEKRDPYGELGGGLQSRHEPEILRVHRNLTFFDVYRQTPENTWQSEVNRAYDLSLNDVLQPEHIKKLVKKDQAIVTTAVQELHETLNHRAPMLLVEGSYENPIFAKYNLESQDEANNYAGILFALRDSLDEQPVVRQLIAQHRMQHGNKKVPQRKLEEARQLKAIVIDDNNEVLLVRSGSPVGRGLHSAN